MKPQSSSPSSAAALLAFFALAFALSWTCWLLAPALKVDFPVEAAALSLTGDFGSSLAAVAVVDYSRVQIVVGILVLTGVSLLCCGKRISNKVVGRE